MKCTPAKAGHPESFDYEYERNETANLFLFTEPLTGWGKVVFTESITAIDWANEIKKLIDEDYNESDKVILVCDQLNVHKYSSLYKKFEPATARELVTKLDIHHTPKHG